MALLEYRAPSLVANCISSHFSSDREAAVVLDVACGTGLVAKQVHSQDKEKTPAWMRFWPTENRIVKGQIRYLTKAFLENVFFFPVTKILISIKCNFFVDACFSLEEYNQSELFKSLLAYLTCLDQNLYLDPHSCLGPAF